MQSRGPPTKRILSNNSVATDISIGTTISTDSPTTSTHSLPLTDDLYHSVLKVILLEYKNEPRFHVPSPSISRVASPMSYSNVNPRQKRHSWYSSTSDDAPGLLPRECIPKLKNTMMEIAIGKNEQVTDPLTKRSLLHLYNDLLKPGFSVEKVEELVVMFIGSATKEINLYREAHQTNTDVFKEADVFISILLGILRECKNSDVSIKKLEDYRESLRPNRSALPITQSHNSNSVSNVRPTYRLSEISSAKLIGELFCINEVKLQQDVIQLKDSSNEAALIGDLQLYKMKLSKNISTYNPDDFDRTDDYFAWKKREQIELETLLKKLHSTSTSTTLPTPKTYTFVPNDPRKAVLELATRVLQFEDLESDILISNTFKDIMRTCCKYWRVNDVSQATILYQAAHLTILKDSENLLHVEKTETLFGLLYKLFQNAEHPKSWSKVDKKAWITNLSNSFIQVMSSLRDSLTLIYGTKAPKLTPILSVLYEYIEPDPLYDVIVKSGLRQRWIKRLRNTILATTESKYIDILKGLPRDDTLRLMHIKHTSEAIYKSTQQLQKKFPKPLLDEILIANEAGFLFIKLYCEDLKNMLAHVEHYALKSKNGAVNSVDAIETYCELRDLRDIYDQVKKSSDSSFSFDLEGYFFKYLESFCAESVKRIFPSVKNSLDLDSFEPMDLENEVRYSHSVLDTFKMINELFAMFRNFGWKNERQMAYIYTKLMKSVSESIVYYCSRIKLVVLEDLKDDVMEEQSDNRKSNIWLFDEMKAAVTNGSKLKPPPPYSFKERTCVALNNLSQMLTFLKELEDQINPERIKILASSTHETQCQPPKSVFTINVMRAENIKSSGSGSLSNTYVTLVDSTQRREFGKTRTVPKSLNPVFQEEFEFESPDSHVRSITATLWSQSSNLSSHEMLGRTVLHLDPRKFRNDGLPEEMIKDFDLQGKLVFEVSLETEKGDVIFSIGRAYRSLTKTMERICTLIVNKFSIFVTHSFSRHTLKLVCGNSGLTIPPPYEAKDAIVPLFDYLNSNLQVLAAILDLKILHKVMVQAWKVVLDCADNLLLPALATVKILPVSASNSSWRNQFNNVMANVTNSSSIPGYGRALTSVEVDCIFIWLGALCDFFYNDGSGPAMEDLKEDHYQRLLLINKHYDESVESLIAEVDRLSPLVLKAIRDKNFLEDGEETSSEKDDDILNRRKRIARSNTILAFGSSKRRKERGEAVKESSKLTGTFHIQTEDIILRILLARDQRDFVSKRLSEREKLAKSFATERLARLAVRGRR